MPATAPGGSNQDDFYYVQKILVYNNGDIYVAAISIYCNAGGILKSTNGGTSWTRVIGLYTGGNTCNNAFDFQGYDVKMSAGGDLYATVYDASAADTTRGKIFKSPAGATAGNSGTWTDITPGPAAGRYWRRIELACAPSNNNRIYAIFQGTGSAVDSIMRSDDAGATWNNADNSTLWCDQGSSTSLDFTRGQAWYDLVIAVKPDDDQFVLAGGVDVMRSTNAGAVWSQITQWNAGCSGLPVVHADIHNIIYLPGSSSSFIVACDGGIYYTSDNGASFTNKNSSFNVTQYYSCAVHPTSGSNYMLAGAQDNGSHRFSGPGVNTVTTATGGDGGFCFIDQDDATYQITSFTGSSYRVSRDGGVNFNVNAAFSGGRFINPADYDNTQNLLYVGGDARNIRRINNITSGSVAGNSYSVAPSTNYAVSAVKVDPNTANRVLVAYSTAPSASASVAPVLYILDNANNSSISGSQVTLPAAMTAGYYISSIDVEDGDASHFLLTISNYGAQSVWESSDAGVNWTSLDNNGVNLPDMPIRWGMFIPSGFNPGQRLQSVGGILLATELGVWSASTINGNTTVWDPNNSGMGNVRVDMLKIRGADKLVAAATHGRGVFTGTLISGNLPVTFRSFQGKTQASYNDLVWEVDNEQGNKGFELERKYPGDQDFIKVGYVAGKNISGVNRYQLKDQLVDLGKEIVFYRLRQVDLDGRFTYSQVLALNRKVSPKMLEYLTVNGNNLFMRINNGNAGQHLQIRIFNASGQLVKDIRTGFNTQQVDISNLVSGTYIVELTGNDNRRITERIVKR